MPDSAVLLPDLPGSADEPAQPAQAPAPPLPLGCLRQATASVPAEAIIPQFICKASACPVNCPPKRTQDAT